MIYLTSQRDTEYFIWQLLVQEKAFVNANVDMRNVYHLVGYYQTLNPKWEVYKKHFKGNIVFIKDERESRSYLLSLRFFLLADFYANYPQFVNKYTFHIDADVTITEDLLLATMEDGRIHLSNTDHYTGYTHFEQTRVPQILEDMCSIVGIPVDTVKRLKAGGAQWFYTGLNSAFFKKCERQSEMMHNNYMMKLDYYKSLYYKCKVEDVKKVEETADHKYNFQHWTFEMWIWLWNIVLLNKKIYLNPELDFSWGTDSLEAYERTNIFHNAGVNKGSTDRFDKQAFIHKFPFGLNLPKRGDAQDAYIDLINSIDLADTKVSDTVDTNNQISSSSFHSYLYITDNTDNDIDFTIKQYLSKEGSRELLIYCVGTPYILPFEFKGKGIRVMNNKYIVGSTIPYSHVFQVEADAKRFLNSSNVIKKIKCVNLLS